MSMTYYEAVDYIINVPRFNKYINKDFKANATLLNLMEKLGNPHLKVKSVHVAGTNGKGSTVQFIKNILVEAGCRVGCFVSPHLIKINERISVWESLDDCALDTYITDDDFLQSFNKVMEAVNGLSDNNMTPLTFFEYMFAIAAVYFCDKGLDYCIYETGLGGRLDATNILAPQITVITSIGLDHTKLLGDTVEKIAAEKAGIIKEGIPVVYNTGDKMADEVISQQAVKLNAPEFNVAKGKYIINDFTPYTIDFSCSNSYYIYHNIRINSPGMYQVHNAMTAIEVCSNLPAIGETISEAIIKKACKRFSWQGRMEHLDEYLIIDGAHNLDAIIPFVKSVNSMCGGKKINILFAVADDKNYTDMIEYLCDNLNLDEIYVTSIQSDRRVLAKEVAIIFQNHMNKVLCKPTKALGITASQLSDTKVEDNCIYYDNDLRAVFSLAYNSTKEKSGILFCVGSLYLIGNIKEIYMEDYKDD